MKKSLFLVMILLVVSCGTKHHKIECPVTTEAFASASVKVPQVCPTNMIFIEGDYCKNVEQICLQWVDATGALTTPPEPGKTGRCGTWQSPSKCLSNKEHKRFCIDIYESQNNAGDIPKSWVSWYDAKRLCEINKKRLCTRSEWTFACEGPDMKPYPYGDGYHRDRTACNFDNPIPEDIDVFKAKAPGDEMSKKLDAMLKPSGSMKRCVSPFGVHDMVGNVDEWVINETGRPYVSGLMSGHIFGVRNACRPMTEIHGPGFGWYETSYRCCSDAK
jgi:sulfatase modifying factor 1